MHLTGRDYWWYQAKEEILGLLFRRFARIPPVGEDSSHQSRILDLGCGTGTMFGFLAERGRVTGLEPSDNALHFAAMRNKASLVRGGAGAIPFQDSVFDLVAMFDCLEHIENDAEAVRETARVIRDDGLLMVTVPAFSRLSSWRETQLGHKRRYSRSLLVNLLQSAGFRPVFTSYLYAALFPILVLKSLKDKLIQPPRIMKSDIVMLPEPWNGLMAGWFRKEARFCNRFGLPFGTSLVCIARPEKSPDSGKRVETKHENAHNTSP